MIQHGTSKKEDQLPDLIAERDRYRQWLDALESERSDIPDHIYERIAADYAARLDKAIEALREHVAALEARLEERRTALGETVDAIAARQDELVESRIRHQVGEWDARRWQSIERGIMATIAELERRRDELEAEVRRLEEALEQVRQPAVSAAGMLEAPFLQALGEGSGRSTMRAVNGNGRKDDGPARGASERQPEPEPTRPRKPTGHRTLHCGACGTFNLADAEFCEGCGSDLRPS
ncbi:MAG TPA: hypothetical protein VF158_02575 [Longimicrobiales bacterium]